jgi:ankyrin repeat protein
MAMVLVGVGVAAVVLFVVKAQSHDEIHRAAGEGNLLRVRQLLDEQPALLEQRNRLQMTPLHSAARLGRAKVIELFAKRGADLNAHWDLVATGDGHWTPLHLAAAGGQEEAARVLVRAGADLNARTLKGQTPRDIAIQRGHRSLAEVLEPAMPPKGP